VNRITLLTTAGLALSGSAFAGSLQDELGDHKVMTQLAAAIGQADAAEAERKKILLDLPAALAAEFLVPSIAGGEFSGEDDALIYNSSLDYADSGDVSGVLTDLGNALGTQRGGETVCISTLGGATHKVEVHPQAVEALLQALGTSSSALAPVTTYLGKAGDSSVVLAEGILGTALFEALSSAIDDQKAGTPLKVRLDVDTGAAGGKDSRTMLLLTTTDGQRLKLEVELDGPKKSVIDSIPEGAVWRVSGSAARVPFDKSSAGQIALLTVLLKEGRLTIGDLEKSVYYPSAFGPVAGADYAVQVLGEDNAWYGTSDISVKGGMEVARDSGDCGTTVVFASTVEALAFGPLPDTTWNSVTRFRPVRTDAEFVDLGYLLGPACASDPSGISDEDFDEVMGRGETCQTRCDTMQTMVQEATAKLTESKLLTDERATVGQRFDLLKCRSSCMRAKGYRACLDSASGIKNAGSFMDAALICEDRRP